MYPVSDRFLQAIRTSHTSVVRVEVWNGGSQVSSDLAFESGDVTVDGTPGGVRRTLNLTTVRDSNSALWDLLAPIGTEIVPYRGVRFTDGTTEYVPLGVFGIDSQRMSYGVDGRIQLTAPDRWALVQRARFLSPTTTTGSAISEAVRLTKLAVNVASTNTAGTVSTPSQVWDQDRAQAITELVKAAAAEEFFDVSGLIVTRPVPKLTNMPVWTVDAGVSGVLVTADRERDRSRTFNIVVASYGGVDGSTPYTPQVASDTDPTSPTYVSGPFGQVPYFYVSPLLTTAASALAAAKAILTRVTGLAAQVNLGAVTNPALDAGDVITVVLPDLTVERHLIDTVTIPLDVDSAQQITTRSTRPAGDVPDS